MDILTGTKSADTRDATPPVTGGVRDAIIASLVLAATYYVTSQTGSPEAGEVAGAVANKVAVGGIGALSGLYSIAVNGAIIGIVTSIRKAMSEEKANAPKV